VEAAVVAGVSVLQRIRNNFGAVVIATLRIRPYGNRRALVAE